MPHYCFVYIHSDITQITAQVLDNMRLLRPVKNRQWSGIALFGPHTGIRGVYSHSSNMGDKVQNKCYGHQLYTTRVKENLNNVGEIQQDMVNVQQCAE